MKKSKINLQKLVTYSYPSSTNAEKFGFSKTGCYSVELYAEDCAKPPKAIAGFKTEAEAIRYAETLPNDWHRFQKLSKGMDTGFEPGTINDEAARLAAHG